MQIAELPGAKINWLELAELDQNGAGWQNRPQIVEVGGQDAQMVLVVAADVAERQLLGLQHLQRLVERAGRAPRRGGRLMLDGGQIGSGRYAAHAFLLRWAERGKSKSHSDCDPVHAGQR